MMSVSVFIGDKGFKFILPNILKNSKVLRVHFRDWEMADIAVFLKDPLFHSGPTPSHKAISSKFNPCPWAGWLQLSWIVVELDTQLIIVFWIPQLLWSSDSAYCFLVSWSSCCKSQAQCVWKSWIEEDPERWLSERLIEKFQLQSRSQNSQLRAAPGSAGFLEIKIKSVTNPGLEQIKYGFCFLKINKSEVCSSSWSPGQAADKSSVPLRRVLKRDWVMFCWQPTRQGHWLMFNLWLALNTPRHPKGAIVALLSSCHRLMEWRARSYASQDIWCFWILFRISESISSKYSKRYLSGKSTRCAKVYQLV